MYNERLKIGPCKQRQPYAFESGGVAKNFPPQLPKPSRKSSYVMTSLKQAKNCVLALLIGGILCLWGCSSKKDAQKDEDSPITSEEEAQQVQLQFDGVFRHQARVYDRDLITELELSDEGLQQRRDGLVVFDAPCTKHVRSVRRVDFECGAEEGEQTVWPLAFSDEGELYHQAMPEMRYARVERENKADDDNANPENAPPNAP